MQKLLMTSIIALTALTLNQGVRAETEPKEPEMHMTASEADELERAGKHLEEAGKELAKAAEEAKGAEHKETPEVKALEPKEMPETSTDTKAH